MNNTRIYGVKDADGMSDPEKLAHLQRVRNLARISDDIGLMANEWWTVPLDYVEGGMRDFEEGRTCTVSLKELMGQ